MFYPPGGMPVRPRPERSAPIFLLQEARARPGTSSPRRPSRVRTSPAGPGVTLRKNILKHLGVSPGEQVSVEKLPDGRVEVKAAPTGKISDVFDYLKKPGRRALSVDEMNQIAARGWADQARAGRK